MIAGRSSTGRLSIVVGYDGSDPARAAVAHAAERAGDRGKVYIVHCCGAADPWGVRDYQRLFEGDRAQGNAVLDALLLQGGDALMDVDYELELRCGDPAEAIAEVAAAHDADEIVIGSRGFNSVRSALGSVSRKLLHLADRPVTVIPYQAVGEHAGARHP